MRSIFTAETDFYLMDFYFFCGGFAQPAVALLFFDPWLGVMEVSVNLSC